MLIVYRFHLLDLLLMNKATVWSIKLRTERFAIIWLCLLTIINIRFFLSVYKIGWILSRSSALFRVLLAFMLLPKIYVWFLRQIFELQPVVTVAVRADKHDIFLLSLCIFFITVVIPKHSVRYITTSFMAPVCNPKCSLYTSHCTQFKYTSEHFEIMQVSYK